MLKFGLVVFALLAPFANASSLSCTSYEGTIQLSATVVDAEALTEISAVQHTNTGPNEFVKNSFAQKDNYRPHKYKDYGRFKINGQIRDTYQYLLLPKDFEAAKETFHAVLLVLSSGSGVSHQLDCSKL